MAWPTRQRNKTADPLRHPSGSVHYYHSTAAFWFTAPARHRAQPPPPAAASELSAIAGLPRSPYSLSTHHSPSNATTALDRRCYLHASYPHTNPNTYPTLVQNTQELRSCAALALVGPADEGAGASTRRTLCFEPCSMQPCLASSCSRKASWCLPCAEALARSG
jgi:hypothetical protein